MCKLKATRRQLEEAIMAGMNTREIAEMYGYACYTSVYAVMRNYGLKELYQSMEDERKKRREAQKRYQPSPPPKRPASVKSPAPAKREREIVSDEPLFATENGKVVINNLHLALGHVEPYLPGKFGKVV